jgi:hypothetical protein
MTISTVPLKLIKEKHDSRVIAGEDDRDQVDKFIQLYESGRAVLPLEVSPVYVGATLDYYRLDEGRTRFAALNALGRETTEVVIKERSMLEAIFYSYNANEGGPKPQNFADLKKTIENAFQEGASRDDIKKNLSKHVAEGRLERAIAQAHSNIYLRKIAEAKRLWKADPDRSVDRAANTAGITTRQLIDAMADTETRTSIGHVETKGLKRTHTKQYTYVTNVMARLMGYLDEGQYDVEEVASIVDQHENAIRLQLNIIERNRKRMGLPEFKPVRRKRVKAATDF